MYCNIPVVESPSWKEPLLPGEELLEGEAQGSLSSNQASQGAGGPLLLRDAQAGSQKR